MNLYRTINQVALIALYDSAKEMSSTFHNCASQYDDRLSTQRWLAVVVSVKLYILCYLSNDGVSAVDNHAIEMIPTGGKSNFILTLFGFCSYLISSFGIRKGLKESRSQSFMECRKSSS